MANSFSWLSALADPWSVAPRPDVLMEDFKAWPTLAAGVRQLLSGETGIARTTFDQQYRTAADNRDGGAAQLALALGWLAEVRHFNSFPEGYGAGSIEIALRWNGVERAHAFDTRVQEARAWAGADAVDLLRRWLQFIAGRLSALVTVRDARDHQQKDLVLQLHVQQCEFARDDARALSLGLLGFVERSIAELFSVAGDRSRAEEALARASETYRIAADDAGVASCLVLHSDWLVAPASSALVRNLFIEEAAFPNSELAWNIEAMEGSAEDADLPQGRAALQEAVRLYERAGSFRGVASVLLRLAYIARIEGEHSQQIELTQKAQERFTMAGDPLHAHLALTHHTLALLDARRFPADRDAAQTIGVWGKGPGSLSYALGLGLLFTRAGRQAMLREGDYEKAEACYQLALALNDVLSARCRCSQSQADLAVLHQALGNRERSQTHREEAIDTLMKVDAADSSARSIVQQRAALLIQQLYREALDHRDAAGMKHALQRMEDLNPQSDGLAGFAVKSFMEETREQAAVLIPLYKAVDERNRGNHIESERMFDNALAAARHADSGSKWLEAVAYAQRRHYNAAIQAFGEYQRTGGAFSGLSGTLIELMQSASGSQAERELQIARRRSLEQSFSFMVRVKAYDRAAVHLHELEELAGAEWWTDDERPWRSLSDIAELHEGLGQRSNTVVHYQEALRIYELAIDQLEQRRSLLTRDELKSALAADFGVQYLYFQAVRAALRLSNASDDSDQRLAIQQRAFELSERGRARALLDLLAANLRHPAGTADESPELGKWRGLTASVQLWRGILARARGSEGSDERVEALRQKIEVCERDLYVLEQKIGRSDTQAGKLLSSTAHIASLNEVVARLRPGTVMVQYMTLGDELLVWTITQQGMKYPTIISLGASVLSCQVREFQESCAVGAPLASVKQRAAELGTQLLGPIAQAIEEHERLIITPYGDLNLLPFSALLWREDWLGKQRTVSYLPSASMLLLLPQASSDGAKTLLTVGNPQHMGHRPPFGVKESLPPLVDAETEAQSVAQLYGTRALIGPEATIEAIRPQLSRHRQFLFATHGVLYEEAPLLSGVALANGYVLTVQELMGLRFDADLITVSACKSGLGTRTGGEEIVGLTRGLLAAGARAVVVTLWPVLDLSTAVLMVRFHQHLKKGTDPATALTQAQSWFSGLSNDALHQEKSKLRDLKVGEVKSVSPSHPQHWAPFIFIGA